MAAWHALVAALFFLAAPLFARDVTIVVEDALFSMPLEGALITQNNEKTAFTDEEGCAALSIPEGESAALVIQYPAYRNAHFTVPPEGEGRFIIKLYLEEDAARQNKELVFTAERNAHSTGRVGQSAALPEKERTNAAEIGLTEDVMNAIKLLPGVGYTGMFNAKPSLRGGEPHDVIAVLDGYYLREAYHWDGGYSVFAPSMVESAELFHGVFSARKGWTTSGLLEVESKKSSGDSARFDAGLSTNAFDFSLSLPFKSTSKDSVTGKITRSNKGGVSIFGKITYWDSYIGLTKIISEYVEALEPALAVKKAPYINCAALSLRYKPFNTLELILNAYTGADGVEMYYEPFQAIADMIGDEDVGLSYKWFNFIGFFNAGVSYNPRPSTLIYFTAGGGYNILDVIHKSFSANNNWQDRRAYPQHNAQIHTSIDQQLGQSFIYAAGLELFLDEWQVKRYGKSSDRDFEISPSTRKNFNLHITDISNKTIMSALWTTLEWNSPSNKYRAEAGMRVANSIINSGGETIFSPFAFNPRLTFEYAAVKNTPNIESVIISAGSGLFSSMNKDALIFDIKTGLSSFKETESWTSILAARGKLLDGIEINIELYYKYLFNQTYTNLKQIDNDTVGYVLMFDGYGRAFGVDVMLSKFYSNKLSGWLSYSFNYTRYNNPNSALAFEGAKFASADNHWYFPEFQRFHTVNLVVNYNITARFMLHTRIGFASGPPSAVHKAGTYTFIERDGSTNPRYSDESEYSDKSRNAFSMPLDLKLSWYAFKKAGKFQCEFYIAGENLLVLFLPKVESMLFDSEHGKFYEGRSRAVYDLQIPMASFGFKLSY